MHRAANCTDSHLSSSKVCIIMVHIKVNPWMVMALYSFYCMILRAFTGCWKMCKELSSFIELNYWPSRNIGHRGILTIVEYWPSRNIDYRGILAIEEYWPSVRNIGHRGILAIVEYWPSWNNGHRGILAMVEYFKPTEDQIHQ